MNRSSAEPEVHADLSRDDTLALRPSIGVGPPERMRVRVGVWSDAGLSTPPASHRSQSAPTSPAQGKLTVVRTVVKEASASIVCMVESKLATVDRFTIMGLLGPSFDGFAALPANNTAYGIHGGTTVISILSIIPGFLKRVCPKRRLVRS